MKRAGFVLVLVVLAALTVVFGVRREGDPSLYPARGADSVTVWVVDNGYHSNVIVERSRLARWPGLTARALASVPPGDYVAIGWGDRRFFTESGFSFARAMDGLRAAFFPGNPSVVMLEPVQARPDRLWSSGVVALKLSPEGFARMMRRVDGSFDRDRITPGPRGPNPEARFFDSDEHFSIVKLCNHWTADLLSHAGVPTRPVMDTVGAGLGFDLRTWAAKVESDKAETVR